MLSLLAFVRGLLIRVLLPMLGRPSLALPGCRETMGSIRISEVICLPIGMCVSVPIPHDSGVSASHMSLDILGSQASRCLTQGIVVLLSGVLSFCVRLCCCTPPNALLAHRILYVWRTCVGRAKPGKMSIGLRSQAFQTHVNEGSPPVTPFPFLMTLQRSGKVPPK